MSRRICIALIGLALSWASNVNPAAAQNPAKTDKLVRVTYPVADLVVPVEDHTAFSERTTSQMQHKITKDTNAMDLVKRITDSVAPKTWENAGGKATIQYFPLGLAIVVYQSEDVHKEIARLLADLRRLQDVQVCIDLRCIRVSAGMAKQFRTIMDTDGEPVKAGNIAKPAHVGRFVSVDDRRLRAMLELAQTDRAASIMQAPKLTVYDGQQAGVNGMLNGVGVRFDVWPVAAADRKSVRFALNLEHAAKAGKKTEAVGTFTVPANRGLIWHVGETQGQHLFVVVAPRVIVVEEENISGTDRVPDKAEEQSIPEPTKPANGPSAREKALQYRLNQPITLNFKDLPLRQAIKEIAAQTGVVIVPDLRAFRDSKISMDAPLSGSCDDIAMKYALNVLLRPMRLQWIIEDEVLVITTEAHLNRPIRKMYKVGDILTNAAIVPVFDTKSDDPGSALRALVQDTIERNSWEEMGGCGSIQYLPLEKKFIVSQTPEIQEEIELLLECLRKVFDVRVDADVRFVELAPATAGRWAKDLERSPHLAQMGGDIPLAFAIVDDNQLRGLLETAQSDASASIKQQAKLALLNGQKIRLASEKKETVRLTSVRAKDEGQAAVRENRETGWRLDLQTVVSPDRRSVRIELATERTFKGDEGTTKNDEVFTLTVKDGQTLVRRLGAAANGQHLFVLVTPRVIVRERESEEPEQNLPIPGR